MRQRPVADPAAAERRDREVRIRLHGRLRFPHDIEPTVTANLADPWRQPGMIVFGIDPDRAFRGFKCKAEGRVDETLRIQRAGDFQRQGEKANLRVGAGAPHADRFRCAEQAMKIGDKSPVAVAIE
jgi:hypothetical protein